MKSLVEKTLDAAKAAQPDLWARTEQIARIIDPGAFMNGWRCNSDESRALLNVKLKYMQAVALRKAQDILRFLGVNTDADWYEILNRLRESPDSVKAMENHP